MLRHKRLGHPYHVTTSHVLKQLRIHVHVSDDKLGKMHQKYFASVLHSTTIPFEIVHTNIWGPSSTVSVEGFKY